MHYTVGPALEYVYGTVQVFLESVHDLGVGKRHLAMSQYKLKASVTTKLIELHT